LAFSLSIFYHPPRYVFVSTVMSILIPTWVDISTWNGCKGEEKSNFLDDSENNYYL
jgi:hypothetical protein